jgi:hypothetical protein
MNERIRSLAVQAKAYANQCTKDIDGDVSWHWMDYYTEKFAELIVRECVAICQDIDGEEDAMAKCGRQDCAVEIKEHFGVEE